MDPRLPRPPRVLFVTPECAPLTKTGGLGDVSGALPAALAASGLEIRVLLPAYPQVLQHVHGLSACASPFVLGMETRLLEGQLPNGVPLLALECPPLYARSGGPYQSSEGRDWEDNALRFAVLSRMAAFLAGPRSPLAWRPDVVHCNDWPAGLAAAYLRYEPAPRAACLMTIHNLAFQGNFDAGWIRRLELPPETYHLDGLEFYGRLSFLKAGIAFSDAVTTVSPGYAREMQTAEYGCGMEGILRRRAADLHGILNGIDTSAWNPATDRLIARTYGEKTLSRKAENKAALQRALGLQETNALPLLGMVSRFTEQKGIDLVAACADDIAGLPAQLAVLGTGERRHEEAMRACAARHPGRIAVQVGFSEPLAHAIEAGADVFLMPSRFEPCGLNQMYSQRYGTPPLARATGGLADTVLDGRTGFLFDEASPEGLLKGLRRALEAWRSPRAWRRIQRQAMGRDFSWGSAARRYADLYLRLASLAQA